jgi:hypothetical protein
MVCWQALQHVALRCESLNPPPPPQQMWGRALRSIASVGASVGAAAGVIATAAVPAGGGGDDTLASAPASSVLDAIGNTPLIRLQTASRVTGRNILVRHAPTRGGEGGGGGGGGFVPPPGAPPPPPRPG